MAPSRCASASASRSALPYRPPFDWRALLAFLAVRATPGVEAGRRRRLPAHGPGRRRGRLRSRSARRPAAAALLLRAAAVRWRGAAAGGRARAARVRSRRRSAADRRAPRARTPRLRPLVNARPGLRVPGAWDPFELAVRGILGQQITVAGATTLTGRLVERCGTRVDARRRVTHLFPTPAALAMPTSRRSACRARASRRCSAWRAPSPAASCGSTRRSGSRTRWRGSGPSPASANGRRSTSPCAVSASPMPFHRRPGARHALGNGHGPVASRALSAAAEAWRPWRAYATVHLWARDGAPQRTPQRDTEEESHDHHRHLRMRDDVGVRDGRRLRRQAGARLTFSDRWPQIEARLQRRFGAYTVQRADPARLRTAPRRATSSGDLSAFDGLDGRSGRHRVSALRVDARCATFRPADDELLRRWRARSVHPARCAPSARPTAPTRSGSSFPAIARSAPTAASPATPAASIASAGCSATRAHCLCDSSVRLCGESSVGDPVAVKAERHAAGQMHDADRRPADV